MFQHTPFYKTWFSSRKKRDKGNGTSGEPEGTRRGPTGVRCGPAGSLDRRLLGSVLLRGILLGRSSQRLDDRRQRLAGRGIGTVEEDVRLLAQPLGPALHLRRHLLLLQGLADVLAHLVERRRGLPALLHLGPQ